MKGINSADALNWIGKFESLLRRLYWFEAVMHIKWIYGDRTFRWRADEEQVGEMVSNDLLKPIDRWTFADGGLPIERPAE